MNPVQYIRNLFAKSAAPFTGRLPLSPPAVHSEEQGEIHAQQLKILKTQIKKSAAKQVLARKFLQHQIPESDNLREQLGVRTLYYGGEGMVGAPLHGSNLRRQIQSDRDIRKHKITCTLVVYGELRGKPHPGQPKVAYEKSYMKAIATSTRMEAKEALA